MFYMADEPMQLSASRKTAIKGILYGQFAYWSGIAVAVWSSLELPKGGVRTSLVLMPILPGILNIAVGVWLYNACDEFIQREI
jgi:hypothetical protein